MQRKIGLIPAVLALLVVAGIVTVVYRAASPPPVAPTAAVLPAPTPTPTATPVRVPAARPAKKRTQYEKIHELIQAAVDGDMILFKKLVRHVDLNKKTKYGDTVLISAIGHRHEARIIKLLLQYGADPNLKIVDDNREPQRVLSPLTYALEGGHEGPYDPETVRALIRYGADASENGSDSLAAAAIGGYAAPPTTIKARLSIMRLLLKAGARVNARDSEGKTPLMKVVRNVDHVAPVQLLLDHCARVNARDRQGRTALMWALSGNYDSLEFPHFNIVRLLVQRGARVNARDRYAASPLILAAKYYEPHDDRNNPAMPRFRTIRLLINHGAAINAADRDGWTPFIYVIRAYCRYDSWQGDLRPLQYLVSRGASVNARTRTGLTPLKIARRGHGYMPPKTLNNLVRFLKNAGAKA